MFISKKAECGIRIIRVLAENGKSQAPQIADLEKIPYTFVQNTASTMVRAGILNSYRGTQKGGYDLKKPLNEISLYDVMTAIDGEINLTQCIRDKQICERKNSAGVCAVHENIFYLQEKILLLLKEMTMDKLLKEQN